MGEKMEKFIKYGNNTIKILQYGGATIVVIALIYATFFQDSELSEADKRVWSNAVEKHQEFLAFCYFNGVMMESQGAISSDKVKKIYDLGQNTLVLLEKVEKDGVVTEKEAKKTIIAYEKAASVSRRILGVD